MENLIVNSNKKKRILKYTFLLVLCIWTIAIFYNLYPKSDIRPHAEKARGMLNLLNDGILNFFENNKNSYPVWHLSCLCVTGCLMPIAEILLNWGVDIQALGAAMTCTMGICGLYLASTHVYEKFLPDSDKKYASLLAMLLIFTGPYYMKSINESFYLGQGIVVPWHNPTTIAVYPIAMLCFGIYLEVIQKNKEKSDWKKWFIFSILLVLSSFAKPSFYQMFVPGMALYCLVELLVSRGKQILFCLYSFLSVLPTCLIALIQHAIEIRVPETNIETVVKTVERQTENISSIAQSAEEIGIAGIGIEWMKVQKTYTSHPMQSLMLMWIFPLFVILIFILARKKNKTIVLSLCVTVSGFLQYTFLYLQMRPYTGDFAWGYYISLGLLFVGCILFLLEICNGKKWIWIKGIGMVLYLGHVIWGIIYAMKLIAPNFFYYDALF